MVSAAERKLPWIVSAYVFCRRMKSHVGYSSAWGVVMGRAIVCVHHLVPPLARGDGHLMLLTSLGDPSR